MKKTSSNQSKDKLKSKIKILTIEQLIPIAPPWAKEFYLDDINETVEFNAATCKNLGKTLWSNIVARALRSKCPYNGASIIGMMKYASGAADGLGSEFAAAQAIVSKILKIDFENNYIPDIGGILYNHLNRQNPMIYFSDYGTKTQNNVYKFGSFEGYDKIAGKPPFNPNGCYICLIKEEIVLQKDQRIPRDLELFKEWTRNWYQSNDAVNSTGKRYAEGHGHLWWDFYNYNEWDGRHPKSREIEKYHPWLPFYEKMLKQLQEATDEDLMNDNIWYEIKETMHPVENRKIKFLRAIVLANWTLPLEKRRAYRDEILDAIGNDDPKGILTARIGLPNDVSNEGLTNTFEEVDLTNINPFRPDKESFVQVEQISLSIGADIDNTKDMEIVPVTAWKCLYKGEWINRVHIEPIITIPLKTIPKNQLQEFKHNVLLEILPEFKKNKKYYTKQGIGLYLSIDDDNDVYWPVINKEIKQKFGITEAFVNKAKKHNNKSKANAHLSWGNDIFDKWMRLNLGNGFISIAPENIILLTNMQDMLDKIRIKKSDVRKHDDTGKVNILDKYDGLKYAMFLLRMLYNNYKDYREDMYQIEMENKNEREKNNEI